MSDNIYSNHEYKEILNIAVKQLTAAFSLSLKNRGFDETEIISILQDSCKILMERSGADWELEECDGEPSWKSDPE